MSSAHSSPDNSSPDNSSPTRSGPAIRAHGLTRRFGEKLAVSPFDLEVQRGQVVGLLGPNGSGKSTFLRMLLGLVPPDAGEAEVDGVRLAKDGVAVRKRCTFSPGEMGLYREMKARAHLEWLLRGREAEAVRRADDICERLELPLDQPVRSYSHGMKRQLLFAAAMAPQVAVRVLDEPTEGLDPHKRARIVELVRDEAAAGGTVLLSSHHLGEVEQACDRFVFIGGGKLLADERLEDLQARTSRLLLLAWEGLEGAELETLLGELCTDLAEVVRVGERCSVLLNEPDPRPLLERLARSERLPQPSFVQYGQLSLGDLYRELYGVEGI